MKKKLSQLELTIDGKVTPEQAMKMRIIKQHYACLLACLDQLKQRIIAIVEPFSQQRALIQTVPSYQKSEKYPEHRNKYLQLKKKRAPKSDYRDCSSVIDSDLLYPLEQGSL